MLAKQEELSGKVHCLMCMISSHDDCFITISLIITRSHTSRIHNYWQLMKATAKYLKRLFCKNHLTSENLRFTSHSWMWITQVLTGLDTETILC